MKTGLRLFHVFRYRALIGSLVLTLLGTPVAGMASDQYFCGLKDGFSTDG